MLDIVPEDEGNAASSGARDVAKAPQARQGSPYVKIGRKFYYRSESLKAWMLAQERDPAAAAAPRRGRPAVQR
jgi:hypothetical protein